MGPAHFAIALAAKPAAPKIPLWVLLIASEILDLLCFAFISLGIESAGAARAGASGGIEILAPSTIHWSHGLFMAAAWSALAAGIASLVFRSRRLSMIAGLVVFSHWLLDLIVHLPDLPLFFAGSPKVGFGLWSTGPGMVISGVLEVALLIVGLAIYLRWRGVFARRKALAE